MTKGCYTCRRRRIVCDNGQPTCRKCRAAGKECLGYQKPLVWVKGGVASRGKMMGRSFDDVMKTSEPHNIGNTEFYSTDSCLLPGSMTTQTSNLQGPGWHGDLDYGNSNSLAVQHGSGTGMDDDSLVYAENAVPADNPVPVADYLPTPWGLVDPLLKDLSPLSRYYIHHYNTHVVSYLVLYPNIRNPYRDLTALIGDSPVLAHALTATGALHYALLYHGEFSPAPWPDDPTNKTPLSLQELENAVTSTTRRPDSKIYEHFLAFKQRTLRQLSLDICDQMRQNDDRTVAAILVLALIDAIESGGGAWKYHLEGAKKLLKCREPLPQPSQALEIMDWLDTFAVDGCLILQLMGSTLSRPGALSKPFYSSTMGPDILKRLEQTSWVGCPAYLLDVIFFVHTQWDQDTDPTTTAPQPTMAFTSIHLPEDSIPLESPAALLQHTQAFDPVSWAHDMQSCLYLPDLSARIALATIYKAAVYLYASRVLSRPRSDSSIPPRFSLPADHKPIATELVNQLSLIPRSDPHFKCLIWPTFIAGAESTNPAQRPVILQLLSNLFYDITSVNVRNAAWVLSLMWQKQDAKREKKSVQGGDYDDDDFDWIQELDDSKIDWLFI